MTYLAFLFATGLYYGLGPGGPLHRDDWFDALRGRVDAIEPDFWVGFALLVVVPSALIALIYGLVESLFGGAAMLIIGTGCLFFAFGRTDYDALADRFFARSRAGDNEGAALVLEEAGADIEADDAIDFGRHAAKTFAYEGFQRWFPAAFYFFLLGPFWAVAYRLIQMSAGDTKVPVGSLRHLVDWLPSRLLLLSFAVVGDFKGVLGVVSDKALDSSIETDEVLLQGIEQSIVLGDQTPAAQVERTREVMRRAWVLWVVIASVVAILG